MQMRKGLVAIFIIQIYESLYIAWKTNGHNKDVILQKKTQQTHVVRIRMGGGNRKMRKEGSENLTLTRQNEIKRDREKQRIT